MHTKSLFVAVLILAGIFWHACNMPNSRELDREAQVLQRQKDVALVNDLNSRVWRPCTIKAGQGWYTAAYHSGLWLEISQFNSDIVAVTINRNPRNRGVDVIHPQPGQIIWTPEGKKEIEKTAKAVK